MNDLLNVVLIGIGATGVMDLWCLIRQSLLRVAMPNYGLVGRWIAHMPRGRFRHNSIKDSAAVRGEAILGWLTHYLVGITFAAMLVAIWGMAWIELPTIAPALAVGVGSVTAPFLLMQPGMGAGIAASRTPHPASARLQSLITHIVFGCGLYLAARIILLID
jgi:hypothetical protein